ncbi:hypothetical protein Tco_0772340 [Tanacetum coccineum]|uniref:Uncharacterized protein n=1 Tax=Tanacetum coccineum TaxID=301880 RepID=A0ABQ4ZHL5_9ASTR
MLLPLFTRHSHFTHMIKTKGFSKLKVQKSNSRVQGQDGRVNSYSEVLIGGNTQGECHVKMKKAQGMGIFTLESLSEKAQGVTITDCHAGNPCVHICDPTSQTNGRRANYGRALMDFTGLSLDKPELLISSFEHKLLFS